MISIVEYLSHVYCMLFHRFVLPWKIKTLPLRSWFKGSNCAWMRILSKKNAWLWNNNMHPSDVYTVLSSYLRIQSRARMKKSLLSWCSSRRRAHCSNVTDMDVLSLALLQLVNLMPFNLRQIWRRVKNYDFNMHHEVKVFSFLELVVTLLKQIIHIKCKKMFKKA